MAKRKFSNLVWKTIVGNVGCFLVAGNDNLLSGAESASSVDGLGAAFGRRSR